MRALFDHIYNKVYASVMSNYGDALLKVFSRSIAFITIHKLCILLHIFDRKQKLDHDLSSKKNQNSSY